jgi:curved DNA-binding protein CbpA
VSIRETLYGLLEALPGHDADSLILELLFRKAVKLNHPDHNLGDLHAPRRFRQSLRANAILRDERHRAIYDQLKEIAVRQRGSKLKRAIS